MGFGYTAGVVLLTAIGVTFVPKLLTPTLPVHVTVQTAPGWEKLGDTFRYSFYLPKLTSSYQGAKLTAGQDNTPILCVMWNCPDLITTR